MTARICFRLFLRLAAAAPRLPLAVVWFHGRALCLAMACSDVFSLRSATSPRQLTELLRLARGRRTVVELGTATGWTAAALVLADPERRVTSCDPFDQTGRERYLRLLRPSARARVTLVALRGAEAAGAATAPVDLLYIDSSHERQATVDEWHAWRPRLAPGAVVRLRRLRPPGVPGRRGGRRAARPPGRPPWRHVHLARAS